MQIAQSEILSLVNYNSIGIRNIQSVFYNGSTQEHIIITLHKIHHLVFKLLRIHLSMRHTYLHIRNYPVKNIIHPLKFLHLVMQEENLTSAIQLIIDYIPDFILIEEYDLCLNRNPVRWWSADNRKVSRPKKREL